MIQKHAVWDDIGIVVDRIKTGDLCGCREVCGARERGLAVQGAQIVVQIEQEIGSCESEFPGNSRHVQPALYCHVLLEIEFYLPRRHVGAVLQQQGYRSGDVRCRHRRSALEIYAVVAVLV